MSIIYDALKKVEQSQNVDLSPKEEKKINPKFKIYSVYIAAISLGFLIANMLFNFFVASSEKNTYLSEKNKRIAPAVTPQAQEQRPQGTPAVAAVGAENIALAKQPQPPPALVLNGVFFSQEEGYALINNQIAKKGDKIEGATVVRITLNTVELKFAGSLIKLSTRDN